MEPFVGGGALLFYLKSKNNVINDTHAELINFYRQIQNGHSKDIYRLMCNSRNDESFYYYIRDEYKPNDDIERAYRFLYLRKTCYRGMLRYNKSGNFNVPFGWYKNFNFEELANRNYEFLLKNTEIYNTDFQEVMEKYDREDTFIFLDPPYDSKFNKYEVNSFSQEEHKRLADLFKSCKAKILMIIGKSDLIFSLYEDYIYGSYSKKYGFRIHSGRIGNEINNEHLIVKNY